VNGLTQAAMAELLGVEQATVSRWERGVHQPELSIQRRLRDLMRGQGNASDQIIFHRVYCSLAAMKIANCSAQNLAASREAGRLHGVASEILSRCNYRPFFTEMVEHQWNDAIQKGFFAGEVASIRVYNPWRPVNGQPVRYCVSYWTPARLSDGEILLLSEFMEVQETEFLAVHESERFVMTLMDELIG
jgi:transcriptional regulator with XRE-family HTH domain